MFENVCTHKLDYVDQLLMVRIEPMIRIEPRSVHRNEIFR